MRALNGMMAAALAAPFMNERRFIKTSWKG
jgi:hypothetical protein